LRKTAREKIMTRKIPAILIITVIPLFFKPLSAEDSFNPQLNLQPGESYLCTMQMETHVRQTIEGREQAIDQDLTIVWDYVIQSKDDSGEYDILVKYSRIKSKQKFGLQTVKFDSEDESEYIDPSMIGYKVLVGSELNMRLTPSGKVVELSGFEKIIDEIIEELNIPNSPERDNIIRGLRKQFGDEALRQSLEQMTIIYPGMPVLTGDTWNISYEMDYGFPMIIESDCTLISREDGIANIDLVSAIRSNPNSEGIDMGMFSLDYDIEGNQKGLIKLDEVSGLPLNSNIEQNFTGTVSVSGTTDLEEDNWPISGDGRVIITFKRQ
jgi:hypothetical protein